MCNNIQVDSFGIILLTYVQLESPKLEIKKRNKGDHLVAMKLKM